MPTHQISASFLFYSGIELWPEKSLILGYYTSILMNFIEIRVAQGILGTENFKIT
jgi:hypothetical protein